MGLKEIDETVLTGGSHTVEKFYDENGNLCSKEAAVIVKKQVLDEEGNVVYETAEEVKKKKMKPWKKTLILLACVIGFILLLFIVLLVIIGVKTSSNDISVEETTTTIYDQKLEIEKGEDDFTQLTYDDVGVKLSDSSLADFESYLKNTWVDYDYSDAYGIDSALSRWHESENLLVSTHAHDVRVNGVLDAEALYEIVKANNNEFMSTGKEYFYEEYSDSEVKNYCKEVVDTLNDIHEKNPDFDFDSVCCYLYELKILNRPTSTAFAAVELESKILYFNESMIESWSDIRENENMRIGTLYHEMMHIFQASCPCNQADGEKRVGIFHEYEELEINPLAWYWLVEASAEMNACELLDIEYNTYPQTIGYADTLNYVLNLNGSDDTANIQDICFTTDFNSIFELFDVTEEVEKEEFIKMMFSIQILQQDDSDFFDWYDNEYGIELASDDEELAELRLCLKEDFLLSITKLFYRNLARLLNEGEVTLSDVYYLMRVFEADLNNHLSTTTVGYLIYFKDFYPAYLEIQNEFLSLLSQDNGIDAEKLSDDFQNYSMNIIVDDEQISPNCTLAFLTSQQKDAVISFCDGIYKKGYPTVYEENLLCEEWLEKAPYEDLIINT